MENDGTKPIKEEYHLLKDGEWFEINNINNFDFACCDCGLTHTFKYAVELSLSSRMPRLFFKAVRNKEDTEANRSKLNITITKKENK